MFFKNNKKEGLERLFSPRSIAIIGASETPGKIGTSISENALSLGYEGGVFFINPKHEELHGHKCYKNVAEIDEVIDTAILAIPSQYVLEAVREASEKIRNFVIISAGFSETGSEGKKREKELLDLAEEKKLNILGPNCLGFINPEKKLNASFAIGLPKKGNVSFVSQSGALMVAFLDKAEKRNIGFSSVVSVGNKMQLDESDFIEYLSEDPKTDVIALYLEGIKDGKRFIEIASKASMKKPIIILKAGRSEKAQKAISSHTGALAGSDNIMDVAFERSGVMRAQDIEEFFSLISLCSKKVWREAGLVDPMVIVTNAGGPGVLTADAFDGKSIKIAEISNKVGQELREFLPKEGSVENPIDLLGDAQDDRYEKALNILDSEKSIGSLLVILTPQDKTPVEKVTDVIIRFQEKSKKPLAASFIGGTKVENAVDQMREKGIVHFDYPDMGVEVLDKFLKWKKESLEKREIHKIKINSKRGTAISKIIEEAKKERRSALRFDEASEVMDMYGINTVKTEVIGPQEKNEIELNYPVVAKIDSDKVLHKSDQQALILNIESKEELDKAVKNLQERFDGEFVVVQEMLTKGAELIFGIKRDPIFGPVVLCGLGGIYTEIFKKIDFFISPLSKKVVIKKLQDGELGFLFKETRGQNPYKIESVAETIISLMEMAEEVPEVKEFDINPMFIYNDSKEDTAVDVKIIF